MSIEERAAEISEAKTLRPAATLRRLHEKSASLKETGMRLGVSGTAISTWIKTDAVPLSVDLAAQHLLSQMEPAEPPKIILTAAVPENLLPAVESVLSAMFIPFSKMKL